MPIRRFRLYLDECGTEDYACVDGIGGRYLSLVGVIMDQSHVAQATDELNGIKQSFFPVHPDEPPVIIHRTDIQRFRGPFQALREPEIQAAFNEGWMRFLRDTQFSVIVVVIDKKAMQKKENWRIRHPYHYAMSILVEKYAHFLRDRNSEGDIMPEKRGRQKDEALQAVFNECRENGTYWAGAGIIQKYMPAQTLKFRTKDNNITGLQICDSVAKPAQDAVLLGRKLRDELSPFSEGIRQLLMLQKFHRSGGFKAQIWGYGVKFLPY